MDANQNLVQKAKQKRLSVRSKPHKMKIATCSCGTEILVVPDLAAMNRAIDSHLSKHHCDAVFLLEQIFKAISE